VNGKRVKQPDVEASNGVIHIMDEVIFPFADKTIAEIVAGDPRLTTLITAVGEVKLAQIMLRTFFEL